MPTPTQNAQVVHATTGFLVSRASTATGNTPLATGPTNLFTIAGGRILVVALVGTVTTIIQGQATTVQLISTPTAGTAVNLSNSTGDLNGKEVGATVTLGATLGSTAVVANAGANVIGQGKYVLAAGTINVTFGAASTGAVKWDLLYVPLDLAASVTAAA